MHVRIALWKISHVECEELRRRDIIKMLALLGAASGLVVRPALLGAPTVPGLYRSDVSMAIVDDFSISKVRHAMQSSLVPPIIVPTF